MSTPRPILEPAAYSHVFDRWRGATIVEFWGPGNVGDLLIRHGAQQLYSVYGITVTCDAARADAIFYGGGGNMGPMYPGTRLTRLKARAVANERGIPLIVLPQSWTGPEEFDADQFFAREHRSLQHCPQAVLAPDLGLAYVPKISIPEPQYDFGWFMRADGERRQPTIANNCGDPTVLAATSENYVRLAAAYRVIHTDRLHFAIAAMIAEREAHLYANSYFKNEAIFHLWLKGRGCHFAASAA